MGSHFARILSITITVVAVAEAFIASWLSFVIRGAAFSATQWIAVFGLLLAFNFAAFPFVRRSLRALGIAKLLSHGWIFSSVAALLTGALLVIGLPLAFGVAWLVGAGSWDNTALFIWVPAVAVALGFGSVAWGVSLGQSRARVDHVTLPAANLSPELESLRIAHITDLHIGPLLDATRLRRFVEQINDLEPDLIAITGDIFDFDPEFIEEGCRELAKLHAKHGVFAVLGNHDVYTGLERVASGLANLTSIRVLRNEWERLSIGESEIVLAGVEDPGSGWTEHESEHDELDRLAAEMPQGVPTILLAHRPSWFSHAARLGFDVVLSGHTHGGQVALPLAPNLNPSRLIAHRTRGLYTEGRSALYVSRGLGVAGLPLRFNCPREIALLRLAPLPG